MRTTVLREVRQRRHQARWYTCSRRDELAAAHCRASARALREQDQNDDGRLTHNKIALECPRRSFKLDANSDQALANDDQGRSTGNRGTLHFSRIDGPSTEHLT